MLSKIETAYLAILRIVVLIVATIALLVAIFAAATSLPALALQFGFVASEQAQGGTLGEYIDARKATIPAKGTADAPVASTTGRNVPADVNAAAKILQSYSKGAGGMTIPLWEQGIIATGQNVPSVEISRYYVQTLALVRQLNEARGKHLDAPGLKDMLTWNATQFRDDAVARDAKKTEDTAKALFKMYVASIAFVVFILVVFTFLFVKVERSLRVVRTIRVGETIDA